MALPASKAKNYFQTRGKVHLVKDSSATWCGKKREDVNSYTSTVLDCTCQKCLLIRDREWGTRARSKS